MLSELRAEAVLKNVQVEVRGELPSVPLLINPKRFRRIFYNLARNATEAMNDGGKIFVRVEVTPGEVVTEIEDTGPGIAPEVEACLFQPFATHGKMHGTGLGLSICKRIIEDHRGWIAARRERGHGAIFVFGVPRPEAAKPIDEGNSLGK